MGPFILPVQTVDITSLWINLFNDRPEITTVLRAHAEYTLAWGENVQSTVFAFGAHTWNCQFPFSSAVAPSVRVGIESLSLSMLSLVPLALPMDLLKSVSDLRQVYKLLLRVA